MIKSILVPATGTETDLTSLRTALTIARDFSAHITTLHVRLDAVDVAVKTASGQGDCLSRIWSNNFNKMPKNARFGRGKRSRISVGPRAFG
jgi:hypothetical protein